jgi:putative holliday junction resolvase
MKTYLGIDFGKSKIGIAKASEEVKIATPLQIIRTGIDEVKKVIKEEEVDEIVVGYPLSLSGEIGPQAKEVDEFIHQLKDIGVIIHKQDERFSSRGAVSTGDDDSSSAAIILQTYLDSLG